MCRAEERHKSYMMKSKETKENWLANKNDDGKISHKSE
jgi:hypothetical protein